MFRLAAVVSQFSRLSLTPPQISPNILQARSSSFFVRLGAEDIWRGVTSVSNAGRKRGRAAGSSRKASKDLNQGQIIGIGKVNMVWPGLNTSVIRGKELVQRKQLPKDPEYEQRLIALRTKTATSKRNKLSPLERGWSGAKMGGRSLGRPDPVGDETFENFKSTIVDMGMVAVMRGNTGRTRRHKAIVVVGNGNGLIGFASGKSSDARLALQKAKNKAVKKLVYFERFENHTVIHDFYSEYTSAKLIVKKKQRGFGLVCQRIIREICKLVGIKDLYVKMDSRRVNTLAVIRAFMLGLYNQRSFQDVAEEKRLHVVEYREEYGYFPKLIASPKLAPVRTEAEILPNEELDYNNIINKGQIVIMPKKKEPFYWKLPCYQIHLLKTDNLKNERIVRLKTLKRYGALKSFLTIREEERQKKLSEESA